MLLVPLGSWGRPAPVAAGGVLVPSRHYCQPQGDGCPPLGVADMGCWGAAAKPQCRARWRVAVRTKLRRDRKLGPPEVAGDPTAGPQGEPLAWLGYEPRAGDHGFGVGAEPERGGRGWAAARGPRPFASRPAPHATGLGRGPLARRWAQHVWPPVRPWMEPAQSFEKPHLGLGHVVCNRRRFPWSRALLAEAAVWLRARALLGRPAPPLVLADWMPWQLALELGTAATRSISSTHEPHRQNPQ